MLDVACIKDIEYIWNLRSVIKQNKALYVKSKSIIKNVILGLEQGRYNICYKDNDTWKINYVLKKAVLLHFLLSETVVHDFGNMPCIDKINLRYSYNKKPILDDINNLRLVPGAIVREGVYLGQNVVIMPSFINIGAYIGNNTMIDTWSTIGSCAYIGKNCHISGGVGIGGVLEPIRANPVIIEDDCFIGARSEIVDGVIVESGSVVSMGVFVNSSTKIVDRNTGCIIYGKIPAGSVVVPGFLPSSVPTKPGLACAVIVKKVDNNTARKVALNSILRS